MKFGLYANCNKYNRFAEGHEFRIKHKRERE